MKWLKLDYYKKIFLFLGKKVTTHFAGSIGVGFLAFAIELVFALVVQLFLVAIGVADRQVLSLPFAVPVFSLTLVLVLLFVVTFLRAFLQWLQSYLHSTILEEFRHFQRLRLVHWALNSPSVNTAEAVTLFNECAAQAGTGVRHIQSILLSATAALLIGVSLFVISPIVTVAAVLIFALLVVPIRKMSSRIKLSGQLYAVEGKKVTDRLLISIKNLLLIRMYGMEETEEKLAVHSLNVYLKHIREFQLLSGFVSVVPQVLGVATLCGIAYFAASQQSLTPGAIVSYFYLFIRFLQYLSALSLSASYFVFTWPQLKEMASWWSNHSADTKLKPSLQATEEVLISEPVGWRCKGLTFAFGKSDLPIVQGLDLQVAGGDCLVITGPSGVGKSTLLGLILGELQPQSGTVEVCLSGVYHKLVDVRLSVLHNIGYVGPESFLVEGTVLANLQLGLRSVPDLSEIEEAIRQADCHFIWKLGKKLEHGLTDQGQGLSAGQKQRLCLARALLRKPKVLILDEATANLDSETEFKLIQTLEKLKGKMTIVIVTHREALLKLADQHLKLGAES